MLPCGANRSNYGFIGPEHKCCFLLTRPKKNYWKALWLTTTTTWGEKEDRFGVGELWDSSHGGTISASIMTSGGAPLGNRWAQSETCRRIQPLIVDHLRYESGRTGHRWTRPVLRCDANCCQLSEGMKSMEKQTKEVKKAVFLLFQKI